ncbi:MAG: flagellar type III secretion system pore protein FliP [Deltaproteobacteria bacterium]|nr:flagellar type III secretion system pore protein FliP [Deltaproteobacteria bacterium]
MVFGYKQKWYPIMLGLAVFSAIFLIATCSHAADITLPGLKLEMGGANDAGDLATGIKILLLLTILALAPAILITVTAFIRIVVVLAFLRQALGTQQTPPTQVLIALALFLTAFVMAPTMGKANQQGLQPYLAGKLAAEPAIEKIARPFKTFMLSQTREADLALFIDLSGGKIPKTREDVPWTSLLPAFVISELKTAFQMGFLLFLPFLLIDMIVGAILMSMGMMMVPPMMLSLPFKILLFVLADGWHLVVQSLINSFYGGGP